MIGKTVIDRRGGRPSCWVLLPQGVERLMQVPDRMRKAVVFLYCMKEGELKTAGTAFYAGYSIIPRRPGAITVFLTAQHVIAAIQRESDDQKVLMRMNTHAGAEFVESGVDQWRQADQSQEGIDCAWLPWAVPDELGADLICWDLRGHTATEEVIRREALGVGDEVFMAGLFRNHLGRDRNEPIIRIGNIASIPVDPIRSKNFGDMRAVLIEARSIGGLSGSPVFVHMGYLRWREGRPHISEGETPFFFLGLMHGHWDAPEAEADEPFADDSEEKINTGIAIVVPAEQIMKAIRPEVEALVETASVSLMNRTRRLRTR